jgi:hypothetical protein
MQQQINKDTSTHHEVTFRLDLIGALSTLCNKTPQCKDGRQGSQHTQNSVCVQCSESSRPIPKMGH